jgi:hypothetical protein
MDDGSQVLVAAVMQGEAAAEDVERLVARRLRPAAGIEIGDQVFALGAVLVGDVAEIRLRQDAFHIDALPVGGPVAQELFLPLAE